MNVYNTHLSDCMISTIDHIDPKENSLVLIYPKNTDRVPIRFDFEKQRFVYGPMDDKYITGVFGRKGEIQTKNGKFRISCSTERGLFFDASIMPVFTITASVGANIGLTACDLKYFQSFNAENSMISQNGKFVAFIHKDNWNRISKLVVIDTCDYIRWSNIYGLLDEDFQLTDHTSALVAVDYLEERLGKWHPLFDLVRGV